MRARGLFFTFSRVELAKVKSRTKVEQFLFERFKSSCPLSVEDAGGQTSCLGRTQPMKNPKPFTRIKYSKLNGRQQENYNLAKLSGVMADYGFTLQKLNDDWQGADAIALHIDGETHLRIQLKGRPFIGKRYTGKNIWMAFPSSAGEWFVCPHDELLGFARLRTNALNGKDWIDKGIYSWPKMSKEMQRFLKKREYLLTV